MADFRKQFLKNYRLTTAEIFYHFPDYPELIQSYIWQDYDLSPKFPILKRFLEFWVDELEGRLHSVSITSDKLVTPGKLRVYDTEIRVQ